MTYESKGPKLRVVETYASYQGEGPNTSRPTIFLRFAGCNFKCPGWPCDTQHAIQPAQFTRLQTFWDPQLLAERIFEFGVDNVCLTGGEVFLQNAEALRTLTSALRTNVNIECFTNGALKWDDDVASDVSNFIVDWKLPGAGEDYPSKDAFMYNVAKLNQDDAIKFTIKDEHDYAHAKRRYREYEFFHKAKAPKVYAGVVWGALETEKLCEWMMRDQLPWHLNVQVHKFIWHPDKQGV